MKYISAQHTRFAIRMKRSALPMTWWGVSDLEGVLVRPYNSRRSTGPTIVQLTRTRCFAFLTVVFLLPSPIFAAQPTLTQFEEEELVYAAVLVDSPRALQLPKFGLDPSGPDKWDPAFDFYQALDDADPDGSAVFGTYAVNRSTGDVWNGIMCSEYKSARLRKLQSRFRKRLGLSPADYSRLRVPGPLCGPGTSN